MGDNKKITVTVGGLPTSLLVAFIVLKLCKVITWSWIWVLSPLWIPLALSAIVGIVLLLLFLKI
jgi:hypothetical protein